MWKIALLGVAYLYAKKKGFLGFEAASASVQQQVDYQVANATSTATMQSWIDGRNASIANWTPQAVPSPFRQWVAFDQSIRAAKQEIAVIQDGINRLTAKLAAKAAAEAAAVKAAQEAEAKAKALAAAAAAKAEAERIAAEARKLAEQQAIMKAAIAQALAEYKRGEKQVIEPTLPDYGLPGFDVWPIAPSTKATTNIWPYLAAAAGAAALLIKKG
jgi:hypothetical protein